jgi:PPOX class probable F420-dependent enzyme
MDFKDMEKLLEENRIAVATTYRRDGRPQMSLVNVASIDGALAFTTRGYSAKAANLKRDPRCALLLVRPNWRGYGVLDGDAEIMGSNTDPEERRLTMRKVYQQASGKEHPNWEEFDRVMREERRVIAFLRPGRLVGVNAG